MKFIFSSIIFVIFLFNVSFSQDTLNYEGFEDGTLGTWSEISVIGDQNWYASSFNTDLFAKCSGYSVANLDNEDWLISPQINFTDFAPVTFSFLNATANYAGDDIQALVSTNYDGFSDPNTATWDVLTANLSTGNYTWTNSGTIDLSSYSGNGYIAIKYTSTTSAARIWEVDDLTILGTDNSVPPVNSGTDTVTVMQYNLLAYTSGTYISCNQTNNSIDDKDGYLKTILQYIKPDIFTVNEISNNSSDHDRLKANCLNVDGITYYNRAMMTNSTNSWVINELYYNSEKFELVMQDVILNDLRDINVYKLKYTSNDVDGNPIYLYCVVAHLKAGETETIARANMTSSIMTYLDNLGSAANILVMGDFNLYTSTEDAYQNLISHSNSDTKLNDPVNKAGDWNNNSYYAYYHTQSTRYDYDGDSQCFTEDCGSGCGADDRFDFILASNSIMNGTMKISYIPSSYTTIGQDGLHYNSAIIDSPTNTSAPTEVINALYNNSDHYPVSLKLFIDAENPLTSNNYKKIEEANIYAWPNPAKEILNFSLVNNNTNSHINIYNSQGQLIDNLKIDSGDENIEYNISKYCSGIYFYSLETATSKITKKFIVVK